MVCVNLKCAPGNVTCPGNAEIGGLGPAGEVRRSFITTTVREQHPRSHHKGATGRVRTGEQ